MNDKMSAQKNDQVKKQVCVMGDKENTWKKYVYLEDGVLVSEKLVKIENGIEITCEEATPMTHTMLLPPCFENEENVTVVDNATSEVKLIKVTKEPQRVEFVKFYNETKNIGVKNRLENGVQTSFQYYKIENNQEVICEPPEGDVATYFIPLPNGAPDFSSNTGELSMHDLSNGKVIKKIPKANIIQINNNTQIHIKEKNQEISNALISKIKNLSDGEQLLLFDCLSQEKGEIRTLEDKSTVLVSEEDIEKMFPTNIPATMYSIVKPEIEFGVARFMADQVRHLSSLLNVAEVKHYGEINYGIIASKQISNDNRLDFSYRFTATDKKDAVEIATHLKLQFNGILRKIWLAAWSVGDEKKKHTFSVSLLNLMRTCYPERTTNFSESEIQTFYQLLKSMKPAEFILVKKFKKKGKGGSLEEHEAKFIISFLQVHFETGEKNKTPTEVVISLYNVTPLPTKKEKSRFIGAAIKRNTLKLHAKDTSLALYLQISINQLIGGGKKKKEIYLHDFHRSELIEAANLQKTNKSNPRMANKQLLDKLNRCKDKGILKKIPQKIEELIRLEW